MKHAHSPSPGDLVSHDRAGRRPIPMPLKQIETTERKSPYERASGASACINQRLIAGEERLCSYSRLGAASRPTNRIESAKIDSRGRPGSRIISLDRRRVPRLHSALAHCRSIN